MKGFMAPFFTKCDHRALQERETSAPKVFMDHFFDNCVDGRSEVPCPKPRVSSPELESTYVSPEH